jgi:hypothetical protein
VQQGLDRVEVVYARRISASSVHALRHIAARYCVLNFDVGTA